jgi:DNA repair photolyase
MQGHPTRRQVIWVAVMCSVPEGSCASWRTEDESGTPKALTASKFFAVEIGWTPFQLSRKMLALLAELSAKNYRPAPVALGINTDAYQPIERQLKLTRRLLEVLHQTRHPVSIVTKSSLIERDLDLLTSMAKDNLIHISISITTLNSDLARRLEPRAAATKRRLQTLAILTQAGIPVSVLIAPLIPVLNDCEMETILQHSHDAGAVDAGYVLLRLPHEVKDLFAEWLQTHEPL